MSWFFAIISLILLYFAIFNVDECNEKLATIIGIASSVCALCGFGLMELSLIASFIAATVPIIITAIYLWIDSEEVCASICLGLSGIFVIVAVVRPSYLISLFHNGNNSIYYTLCMVLLYVGFACIVMGIAEMILAIDTPFRMFVILLCFVCLIAAIVCGVIGAINKPTTPGSQQSEDDFSSPSCWHAGCEKPAVTSGDSVYCSTHSNICQECGCFIDEDAMLCMSCLYEILK